MRIRNFIFGASVVVSVLFFGGSYLLLDRIFGEVLRANAEQTSEAAAKVTFAAMYQLMSQGWSRSQADAFVAGSAVYGAGKDRDPHRYDSIIAALRTELSTVRA